MFREAMSLIITVVAPGFSAEVVMASKKAGADGATIISGRGASIHENTVLLGVPIQPEKEMVLTLVKKSLRKNVMREIVRTCNLNTAGKGITFALPVEDVSGAPHLFKKYQKEQEKKKKEEQKANREKEEKEKKAQREEKAEREKAEKLKQEKQSKQEEKKNLKKPELKEENKKETKKTKQVVKEEKKSK